MENKFWINESQLEQNERERRERKKKRLLKILLWTLLPPLGVCLCVLLYKIVAFLFVAGCVIIVLMRYGKI
jgi:hypothetical protein